MPVKLRNILGEVSTTSPFLLLCLPVAHGTAAYPGKKIVGFERLRGHLWYEHLINSCEPEAVFIGEIMTGASAVAFKERIMPESL